MLTSQKKLYVLRAVAVALSIVAVGLFLGTFTDACRLPVLQVPGTMKPTTWCWEFWLQRYQSLIGTGIAAVAAFIAYRNYLANQAREKETERRAAKFFQGRLIDFVNELELYWAPQIDVDENLVRMTREALQYGHPEPMARFDGLIKMASAALEQAKDAQSRLKSLVMEVTDPELERHLRPYHGLINMVVQQYERRISHARRAVQPVAISLNEDWYLPDDKPVRQTLDTFKEKALTRAEELAKSE